MPLDCDDHELDVENMYPGGAQVRASSIVMELYLRKD